MNCGENCCSKNNNNEHHGCGCCKNKKRDGVLPVAITVLGTAMIVVSFLPFISGVAGKIILALTAVLCGFPVFAEAIKELKNRKTGESLLLLIAVAAALLLGEFFEAAMVTVLFRAGELMEEFASGRSRRSVESLFSIISETANLVMPDGSYKTIDADEIESGNVIAVLPHELIPVDGTVISGAGAVDCSSLTGESVPVTVSIGSKVLSGTVNGNTTLIIEALAGKACSSAARVVELVEEAAQRKSKTQTTVAVFAKYYTPSIIIAAVLVAVVPSIFTGEWLVWIKRSLLLLVAACPCAIVLSVPLAFFSSMGAAAKNGIIIKGSNFIETLAKADTAVFDKTGTLTTGKLTVGNVYCADGIDAKTVLELAAKCEHFSSHPIAAAIVEAAGETDVSDCGEFSEYAGLGTSAQTPQGAVLCGGERLMKQKKIDVSFLPNAPVYVTLDGVAVGALEVGGEIRIDSPSTIARLKKLGVENTVILTGDNAEQARKVCSACRIDDFRSGLMPEDKLTELEEIKSRSKGVIYVGDGINDAPVLAAADVGIAMGLGTQAACDAADVILTNSDFSRLSVAVSQSKRTLAVLKANIAFAVAIKLAVIALGVIGVAPMWSAVLADVGTMIICVVNSARLLKVRKDA